MFNTTRLTPTVVSAALEAVRHFADAYSRSRVFAEHLLHAEQAISAALLSADTRSQFLQRLAVTYEQGNLPLSAYQQILVTIGRLLKASADLTSECERITGQGKS